MSVGGRIAVRPREAVLRGLRLFGALMGYGCLGLFLSLVSLQVYRWLRDGEWTHIGVSEGIRVVLLRCCVKDGDLGPLARLAQWLDAPVHWLGLHKVLDLLPASLGLFALAIIGNSIFIYCRDALADELNAPDAPR